MGRKPPLIVLLALIAFLCLGAGLALAAAGGGHSPAPTGDATSSGEAVSQEQPESEPPDTGDQNENDGEAGGQQPPPQQGECNAATAANHGAYVSCVAHTTPKGPGHGKAVSAAAHLKRDEKHAAKASGEGKPGKSAKLGDHGSSSHDEQGNQDDQGENSDS